MMRQRVRGRLAAESGFTLIELLVVIILVGILAGIALAVFLNQQDKGRDASAKSDVTNLVRQIQQCNAGRNESDDFRDCDTPGKLGVTGIAVGSDTPTEISSGDCTDPLDSDVASATITGGTVRVLEAGPDCFVVLGTSGSGNRFWYVKHNGGTFTRGCIIEGKTGCPANGQWAG